MKKILYPFVVTLAISFVSHVVHAQQLYSIAQTNTEGPTANLHVVDATDGSTISNVDITLRDGGGNQIDIRRGTGLSQNPVTGEYFAILESVAEEQANRLLAQLDPISGDATLVGGTGGSIASITFAADGTLYAVTGDGGAGALDECDECLYTLSLSDGSATLVGQLGNGGDGEAIGASLDDGLIYLASGLRETEPVGREIFEAVDPVSLAVTPITDGSPLYEEMLALTYKGNNQFYGAALREDSDPTVGSNAFGIMDTSGVFTLLGHLDHRSKGLANVPEPSALAMGIWAAMLGLGALRRRTR